MNIPIIENINREKMLEEYVIDVCVPQKLSQIFMYLFYTRHSESIVLYKRIKSCSLIWYGGRSMKQKIINLRYDLMIGTYKYRSYVVYTLHACSRIQITSPCKRTSNRTEQTDRTYETDRRWATCHACIVYSFNVCNIMR